MPPLGKNSNIGLSIQERISLARNVVLRQKALSVENAKVTAMLEALIQAEKSKLNKQLAQFKLSTERNKALSRELETDRENYRSLEAKGKETILKTCNECLTQEHATNAAMDKFDRLKSEIENSKEQNCHMLAKISENQELKDMIIREKDKIKVQVEAGKEQMKKEFSRYQEICGLNYESYLDYKKLNNELQEGRGNIRVYCRVRPSLRESSNTVKITSDNTLTLSMPVSGDQKNRSENQPRNYQYFFEQIFGQDQNQEAVFQGLSELVLCSLHGSNISIFCYGQTGGGKTYTLLGSFEEQARRGIISRSVELIFSSVKQTKNLNSCEVSISIQQIHNENVYDLLANSKDSAERPLHVQVRSVEEVMQKVILANENRKMASTACNERSSRSHLVISLGIKIEENGKKLVGSLNLVDLAGSQRIKVSKVEGESLKEAQCINKSLTHLGTVIAAMIRNDNHIPFRSSKLTHIMQPYLTEGSKTLMFVNISPDWEDADQTKISLSFAESVRLCKIAK